MTDRTERKLGRAVLELVIELQSVPTDNLARFNVVRRQLERAAEKYTGHTKSDVLLHPAEYYGFERRYGEQQ